jgi:hypothetical protein
LDDYFSVKAPKWAFRVIHCSFLLMMSQARRTIVAIESDRALDMESQMVQPTIKLWAEVENPAIASERAQQIRAAILSASPDTQITRERSDPDAQDVGAVLLVALSHMAVIGVIESVRLVWDRFREPIMVQLPDGSMILVKGATQDFIDAMYKLVGAERDVPDGNQSGS